MKRTGSSEYSQLPRCQGYEPTTSTQAGVTLIEALITVLVVSIGLLGIAALQVVGVQESASAYRHTQAVWLAYDMADRMRANIDPNALNPAVAPTRNEIADHYAGISLDASSSPHSQACGSGVNCNRLDMVRFDSDQWLAGINQLPNGAGSVTEDPVTGGRYLIRVMWDETSAGSQEIDALVGCPSDQSISQACVELWVQP